MSALMPKAIVKQWQYVSAADVTDTDADEVVAAKVGHRHCVAAIQVANSDTTPGTYVHILSATTVIWTGFVSNYVVAAPGVSFIAATFPSPLIGGVGEAINVKVETASQIRFNVQGFTTIG
jgi:hypothetical protein